MNRKAYAIIWTAGAALIVSLVLLVRCRMQREQGEPGTPYSATISGAGVVVIDKIEQRRGRVLYHVARITTLDPATGKRTDMQLDELTTPSAHCSPLALGADSVRYDGKVLTRTGATSWSVAMGPCQALATVGDLVVVATTDASMRAIAIEASTGKIRWSFHY